MVRSPRKIRLKTRFMAATATVLFVLMAIIVVLVGTRSAASIKQEVEARGLAVAHSIAAVSTSALLTYNYVALEQNAEQAGQGTDIVYVIILNKEESVVAFSGHSGWQGKHLDDPVNQRALAASTPAIQSVLWAETGERVLDLAGLFGQGTDIVYVIILNKEESVVAFSGHSGWQGKHLDDPVNQRALAATTPAIQSVLWSETGERVLDLAVPVYVTNSEMKWGTIRVGLSLERMYRQIRRTQLVLVGIGAVALILGLVGAHIMASRITRPLEQVVQATIAAADGDLYQHLDIHTKDEVEDLASNFNIMVREILAQRQQLEERLEQIVQLRDYNDMILASMTNGVITLDLGSRLVSANAAAEAMLGFEGKHWQGVSFRELWPEDNPLTRMLEKSLESRTPCRNQEIPFDTGTGQPRTLMTNSSFLQDGRKAIIGVLVVINDITELKVLEARMRQSDRLAALGTLSAGLAHEIRNPLAAVKTFVQLLPKKISNPVFFDKFQVTVPRELNRINDLIESLLELARPPKLEFKMTSLKDCLMQVADLYRDKLDAADITFVIDEQGPLPKLWADGKHLLQAFSNLIMNATEAMPEGGTLAVRAQPQEGGVIIQFTDSGVGIDEAIRENIFNPFFTTKDRGTGLGLAITHKIIEEHNGGIEVASIPGAGTTFTLTLPGIQE